jgi:protein-tyrosine-phosphatase
MNQVLFVCTHNAGRSQMAEAFFNRHTAADIRAISAGSDPRAAVWPEVIEVMREVGFDLTDRRPRKLTPELQLHADWAITLGCGDVCPYVPTIVESWDIPDPAGRPLPEVRQIRDELERNVRELIETRLPAIRAERPLYQLQLMRLLPSLISEFEGMRTPAEIRAIADAALAHYEEAPVRSFVVTLAHRDARELLREEALELAAY